MIVNQILNLQLFGVYDRGVPNKERITIKSLSNLNLAQYGLLIGTRIPNEGVEPLNNAFFWFGDGVCEAGSWIVVYTGPGENRVSKMANSNEKAYVLHWGFKQTLFHDKKRVPVLFKLDEIAVESNTEVLKQLKIS